MTLTELKHYLPNLKGCRIYRKNWNNTDEGKERFLGAGMFCGEVTINLKPWVTQDDITADDWEILLS